MALWTLRQIAKIPTRNMPATKKISLSPAPGHKICVNWVCNAHACVYVFVGVNVCLCVGMCVYVCECIF